MEKLVLEYHYVDKKRYETLQLVLLSLEAMNVVFKMPF